MNHPNPNYKILENTEQRILLQDIGPWDHFPTITNAAEVVVQHFAEQLHGRPLEYLDSDNALTRLIVRDGQFAGFEAGS